MKDEDRLLGYRNVIKIFRLSEHSTCCLTQLKTTHVFESASPRFQRAEQESLHNLSSCANLKIGNKPLEVGFILDQASMSVKIRDHVTLQNSA